jgi:hypothetical protein
MIEREAVAISKYVILHNNQFPYSLKPPPTTNSSVVSSIFTSQVDQTASKYVNNICEIVLPLPP